MFLDKMEKRNGEQIEWTSVLDTSDTNSWFNNGINNKALSDSTYFKCIKILSESVAKVPLHLKISTDEGDRKLRNHSLYSLLRYRPNEYMSSIDFFKCMEATRQHKGDSFALITRNSKGDVTGLYPITVTKLIIDDVGLCKSSKKNKILVEYEVNNKTYSCLYSDVLHFKGFTFDGITSISNESLVRGLIDTNILSNSYQSDLFKNGLTNKVVVQLTSDEKSDSALKKTQAKFNNLYSSKGRVITVPAGYKVEPLNLSLADSQFSELKRLNNIDLGTVFGIPSYMLGYTENYNNNSLEQSNLSFLSSTLLILLESIEMELNYKLLTTFEQKEGLYFEFNQGVLLRTDSKTQAEILTKYVSTGVYSPADARKILGMSYIDGSEDLIVNAGVLKLKDLSKVSEGGE